MTQPSDDDNPCGQCTDRHPLPFDFTMAFQPIVNIHTRQTYAHEALVRGLNNEPAYTVIDQVNADNRYVFDQHCRVKAIALAAKLKLDSMLSINFYRMRSTNQNAVLKPHWRPPKSINFPPTKLFLNSPKWKRLKTQNMCNALWNIMTPLDSSPP